MDNVEIIHELNYTVSLRVELFPLVKAEDTAKQEPLTGGEQRSPGSFSRSLKVGFPDIS